MMIGLTITIPGLPPEAKPLELVLLPAGEFVMGCSVTERGYLGTEYPLHEETIKKPFFLGRYPVTQAQWNTVMGSNPSSGYGVGDDYPVYDVSWKECHLFIEKLNELDKGKFRLPTDTEWEYACRAGTTTRFYWGEDTDESQITQYAWYYDDGGLNGTKEVGLKLPNPWGLYDMCGNVMEWCHKCYGSMLLKDTHLGPRLNSTYVLRGGCWDSTARCCRSAFHEEDTFAYRYGHIGFRLLKPFP